MIEYYIEPLSTYAGDIDFAIFVISVIVGGWFILTEGVFFWFLWKYRYQEGKRALYVTGKEPELKRWVTIPHALIILFDIAVIVLAVRIWYNVKQDLPPMDEKVRVVVAQWAWTFQMPGPDGVLDTEDDIRTVDELHIKKDTLYHYELQSLDVNHSFSIPVFRLKQDAIPGRTISGWFQATKAGDYDIQCAEMCGIGHGIMGARVIIHEDENDYAAWMSTPGLVH